MSHRIEVVCRPEVAMGFALAGLETIAVPDAEAAASQLTMLARDPRVGVILIEDDLHDTTVVELRRALSGPLPIVVPFPGPIWATPAVAVDEYIVELLRQAIGYRVRLT